MEKTCFSASPPQATPRDLLSRIARALRRGSSGRFPGVPRHCAGRVARRRPGEIQPVTLGIEIIECLVDHGKPLDLVGENLHFLRFQGPKRTSHNARKDLSLAMIVGCEKFQATFNEAPFIRGSKGT